MDKIKKLVVALDEKHLEEIVALDMRNHSPLYDFMVLTTAKNERIISAVLRELKDLGAAPEFDLKYIEGHNGGEWVLADFGDIVVHVFNEEMRTKYNLEKLWGDANRVDVSELLND
ncbi:MAG: ribosome silencing factor [Turicibacter sp.]|nr:ribosome silencing factor [Turicibacter sp.]